MNTIPGIVINERQIELSGGVILTRNHGLNLGAKVVVFYDFTMMKPKDIKLARDVYPGASEPEEKVVKRYDECDVEQSEIDEMYNEAAFVPLRR